MRKNGVCILDIGSKGITALVGERGINNTFLIKGETYLEYDGFSDGRFFSEEKLKDVLFEAANEIKEVTRTLPETIFVGVPGEFTSVTVKEGRISFPRKKKITELDVDSLFDAAFKLSSSSKTLINRSAILYELDDHRRLANPVGQFCEVLKGKLSFIECDNYFIDSIVPTLKKSGFKNVECVSSPLATALYLINPETRDRVALLADVGYITTTVSVIQGDGIIYEKTFDYGGGYITAALTEKLDVDFSVAEGIKRKINLSTLRSEGVYDLIDTPDGNYFDAEQVKQIVKESLDTLCEEISSFLESADFILPEYVPLSITGGGIAYIRGAKEHVSGRLNMVVQVVAPSVPLMDKPIRSSVLSLLDLAINQQ